MTQNSLGLEQPVRTHHTSRSLFVDLVKPQNVDRLKNFVQMCEEGVIRAAMARKFNTTPAIVKRVEKDLTEYLEKKIVRPHFRGRFPVSEDPAHLAARLDTLEEEHLILRGVVEELRKKVQDEKTMGRSHPMDNARYPIPSTLNSD